MIVRYKKPIGEKDVMPLSVSIEKAKNAIKRSVKKSRIISPACALTCLISTIPFAVLLASVIKKGAVINTLKTIPSLSKIILICENICAFFESKISINPIITMGVLTILVPVVLCTVISILFSFLSGGKAVSPIGDEKDLSEQANILYRQSTELFKEQKCVKSNAWNGIATGLSLLICLYIGYAYNSSADNALKNPQNLVVYIAGSAIFIFLTFVLTSVSKAAVSVTCNLYPQVNSQKIMNDVREYRLSVDINTIVEKAIVNKKFYLNYQPIYSIKDSQFKSSEALCRLENDDYGQIPPSKFIPAAESSGKVPRITKVVVEKACEFMASDNYKSLGLEYMDINLSAYDCVSLDNLKQIVEIVDRFNIEHESINFEITETASSDTSKEFWNNVNYLKDSGFSISMDDFGSGYSSLSKVINDEFTLIKLDRSLIATDQNSSKTTLLRDIFKMLEHLNKKILMEGVETKEQLELVKSLGVDYIQGYYYSKPLSDKDFVSFIKEKNN